MCMGTCECEDDEQCEGCRAQSEAERQAEHQKHRDDMLDNLLKIVFISKPEGLNIPYFTMCAISGRLNDANKALEKWLEENTPTD